MLSRTRILGRNMGLRSVMLSSDAPRWSIALAKEAAGMGTSQWSRYRRGVGYVSDAAIARIAAGLGMRVADLLGSPRLVVGAGIPAAWLALPESEEPPHPTEQAPEGSGAQG
jgi:hypothetical protein